MDMLLKIYEEDRYEKKIIIIISVTISIIVLLLIADNIIDNYILESKVKQGIESLSDEAKENLNYDELLADIKAKARGKEVIYASKEEKNGKGLLASFIYKGEEYYYTNDIAASDTVGYQFISSVDNKRIYYSETAAPIESMLQRRIRLIKEFIRENIIGDIIIVIVIISSISCIIVYYKEKRIIKNSNSSKFE